jgi:hypothetical protein
MSAARRTEDEATRRFWWAVCLCVLLTGSLYVGLRLSPSSYGIVLAQLGVADTGIRAGIPRLDRGDEFAWQTPLLQMTIRSGFHRFDITPPYFEDLRTLYALPLLDWALTFKPQFWLFFIAAPATAYSFYHFFLIAIFILGFTVLFIQLGGRNLDSLLMALVLYFASYMQYWWDGFANFLWPFFPWIVLAPLWNVRFGMRLLLFFWLLVSGLLTYFYPPNAIAAAFLAVVMWATIRPELLRWRTLLPLVLTAAAAGVTVLVYLREPIAHVADTVYPGRRVSGGGGVYFRWWLTQFLPTSQMNHHVPLAPAPNICELSTVGSIYVLAILFLAPWPAVITQSTKEERRRWACLGGGLLATQAWMTMPLPQWVGYPLLWHLVPPGRMVVAGGFLLLVSAFVIGQTRAIRITPVRALLLGLTLALAWVLYKRPYGIGAREAYRDWVFIIPVALAGMLQAIRALSPRGVSVTLLASAAALGMVSFGTFNPIQSTTPIFETHRTQVTADLDRRLEQEKRGYLLLPWGTSFFSYAGLSLIALGYPSMAYATFDPAMDLWSRVYPELPPDQIHRLFDNVGTFGFGDVPAPRWVPIYTVAPMAPFLRPGATVCEFIRPSRVRFAPSVGCQAPLTPPSQMGSGFSR